MSLQIRRGTAAQLAAITPATGELIFTTDTQQVFVGNGVQQGGIPIAVGGNGNISGTNLFATNAVSAIGNITGNFIFGNGYYLTGIGNGGGGSNYSNSNTAAFLADFGTNAISTFGNIKGGYVLSQSDLSAVGNIAGTYLFGNGRFLTGITSGTPNGITWTTSTTVPTSNVKPGDFWYNSVTNVKYQYTNDGVGNVWVDQSFPTSFATITTGNIYNAGVISSAGNIAGTYVFGNGAFLTGITGTGNYSNSNTASFLAAFGSNNISSTGTITTTANIQGSYIIGNGSQLTGLPASYSNSNVATFLSAFGSNNISSTGTITTTANIQGSYIIGNGSQLTGLPASYSNSNVATFLSAFGTNTITTTGLITSGNIVPSSNNAYSLGTVTSQWKELWVSGNTIYIGNVPMSLAAGNGLNWGGNPIVVANATGTASTTGNIAISGNITGNYILGNGTYLDGVITWTTNSGTAPANAAPGDFWYNSATGIKYQYTYDGTGNTWVDQSFPTTFSAITTGNIYNTNTISSAGNIVGSYILGNGSQLTGLPATYGNADVANYLPTFSGNVAAGNVSATGNIVGSYILGNGALLSGLAAGYSNASAASFLSSFGSNTISTSGNITSGNILAGAVSASGNITGNYILGNGALLSGLAAGYSNASAASFLSSFGSNSISTSGNITSGNILTGAVSASGNITGAIIQTSGTSGNIFGANNISANTFSAAGQVSANTLYVSSNANILGNLNVQGNVTFINSNVITTNDLSIELANNQSTYSNINGAGLNVGPTGSPLVNWTYASTANVWSTNVGISSSGNITAANVINTGSSSVTGNLSAGNVLTGGLISATGNIYGGNIINAGISSVTGNLSAGNVLTGGLVSATGNITGNYIIGNGSQLTGLPASYSNSNVSSFLAAFGSNTISTSGNVTSGNVLTGGLVSVTGNITSGNVTVTGLVTVTGNVSAGNLKTVGYVTAANGLTSTGIYTGPYTDGIVVDYLTGNARISAGSADGIQFFNGGVANTVIGGFDASGNFSAIGNITGNISTNSIVNSGTSATGNIGSSSKPFNTLFAIATSALYADLAENYLADADYAPGTVVSFGGDYEITQCNVDEDPTIAGVVSTQPAYQMNEGLTGDFVTSIALMGRVPCQVVGPVKKGAMMVSAGNGMARAEANPIMGSVIGKALQSFDGSTGIIEIVVGRL